MSKAKSKHSERTHSGELNDFSKVGNSSSYRRGKVAGNQIMEVLAYEGES